MDENEGAQAASNLDWQDHDDNRTGTQSDGGSHAPSIKLAQVVTTDDPPAGTEAPADPATPAGTQTSPDAGNQPASQAGTQTTPEGTTQPTPNAANENAAVTATFTSTEGVKIVLPAGTNVDTMMVRGDDLLLVQKDGSVIVIVDGAKIPPVLVLGGIEIPSATIAQIIGGAEPGVPTAGAEVPESNGLNVPKADAPVTATFTSSDGAKIALPAGTSIDTVMVRGDNLILVQEDGSIIVIVDGAKFPPTLLLGGIEIPSESLAAILKDAPQDVPAAGPSATQVATPEPPEGTPSSGGEFATVSGNIGDPFPIGDLLPPTALEFFVPVVKEEEPGFLEEEGGLPAAAVPAITEPGPAGPAAGPEIPPDLFPVQVAGVSLRFIVEEEDFGDTPPPNSDAGPGNEDDDDLDGLDTDNGPDNQVTLVVKGSLAALAAGGNPPLSFTIPDLVHDGNPANDAVTDAAGNVVTSLGEEVHYAVFDNSVPGETTIEAWTGVPFAPGEEETGGRLVFTLTLQSNGDFEFVLNDQIDHPSLDGLLGDNLENTLDLNLTSLIKVTDGDGDPLTFTGHAFTIGVIDDTPITRASAPQTVDEDDLTGLLSYGNNDVKSGDDLPTDGSPKVTGFLNYLIGADAHDPSVAPQPVAVSFATGQVTGQYDDGSTGQIESQGRPLYYYWDAATSTLYATWVADPLNAAEAADNAAFKLVVTNHVTGEYEFTLLDQLDHLLNTAPDNGNGEGLPESFAPLVFNDHPPEPRDDHNDQTGDLITPGAYEDNIQLNLTYSVTDFDGDTATGSVAISVDDDIPKVVGEAIIRTVDEDDIDTPWSQGTSPNTTPEFSGDQSVTENNPGNVDPAIVTGSLASLVVSDGADEHVTYGFSSETIAYFESLGLFSKNSALPENGIALTYDIDQTATHWILEAFEPDVPGDGNTSNPVFQFTLNKTTGQFEFRLFDELMHTPPESGTVENTDLRSGGPGFYDPDDNGQATPGSTPVSAPVQSLDFGKIITVTDHDGDSIGLDGMLQIVIRDDVPEAEIKLRDEDVQVDESGENDSSGDTNTNSSTVKNLFKALEQSGIVGNDPHVPGDNNGGTTGDGAIAYARSEHSIVAEDDVEVGADHPPLVRDFSLKVTDGTYSGVQTTEGFNIYLYNGTGAAAGLILGRVGTDSDATPDGQDTGGVVAFALAIDDDGQVSIAQYLSLKHFDTSDHDEMVTLANNAVKAVITVTDSDGDTVTDDVSIGNHIQFDDDGPKVDVDREEDRHGHKLELSRLTLDESIGAAAGDSNAASDDLPGVTAPTLMTSGTLVFNNAIGQVSTPSSATANVSVADLFDVSFDAGADGPKGDLVYDYKLTLRNNSGNEVPNGSSSGVMTDLVVTNLDGPALEGLTDTSRTIWLFKQADGSILGVIGRNSNGTDDGSVPDYVALRITITGSPADPQIVVQQFLPIEHGDHDSHDEGAFLNFTDNDASLGVTLTVTGKDGDDDTDTDAQTVLLVDGKDDSIIKIEDDGPKILEVDLNQQFNLVHDETTGVQSEDDDFFGATLPAAFNNLEQSANNDPHAPHVPPADNPGSSNGAIGFAKSDFAALVNVVVDFGTDAAAATNAIKYSVALNVSEGTDSGLFTTEGRLIQLFQDTGPNGEQRIVGRFEVGSDNNPDEADPAAFALWVDPSTGEMYLVQYMSIKHSDSNPDLDPDEIVYLNNNLIKVVVTAEDGDGDTDSESVVIPANTIGFSDDGPSVTPTASVQEGELAALLRNLDESVQPDGPFDANYDRYNSGETESSGGGINGGDDDVDPPGAPANDFNQDPTVSIAPTADQAIGRLTTGAGALDDLFAFGTPDFGSDGPASSGSRVDVLSFQLLGSTSQTSLAVTALDNTALEPLLAAQRTIYLVKVSDTVIEGRIPGADNTLGTGNDDYVAFRITLNNAGSPGTALITIDQFLPIDHGSDDPSLFDEQALLNLLGDGALALRLTSTVKDLDGDIATSFADVNLISSGTSFIAFDDDGPSVTAESICEDCDPILVHDETQGVQVGTDANNPNDQNDVPGTGAPDALPASILALFNEIVDANINGVDPDVSVLDNDAIGFARSGVGNSGITFTPDYGTDGPNPDHPPVYALHTTDKVFSGVQTTDGVDIYLYEGTGDLEGLILGRVGSGPSLPGQGTPDENGDVAFALAIDPETGELFVAQYLSLKHPIFPDNFDETIVLADDAVQVTVTVTDGDGDQATSDAVGVGHLIGFGDDGPVLKDASVTGVVEEEHLDSTVDPTHLSIGNEDIASGDGSDPDNDADLDTLTPVDFSKTTNVFTGDAASGQSLNDLVDFGSDGGAFSAKDVTDSTLKKANGAIVTSYGQNVVFTGFDDTTPGATALTAMANAAVAGTVAVTTATTLDVLGFTAGETITLNGTTFTVTNPSTQTVQDIITALDAAANVSVTHGATGTLLIAGDAIGDTFTLSGSAVTLAKLGLLAGSYSPRTVFTLEISENGDWTATILDQLDHHPVPEADDEEQILTLDLSGLVNATDGDGDTIGLGANSFTLNVIDDIPVEISPAQATLTNTGDAIFTGALGFFHEVGADEAGTVIFVDTNVGDNFLRDPAGNFITSGEQKIVLSGFGTSILEGRTETGGVLVFRVNLNPSNTAVASDEYTIQFFAELDGTGGVVVSDLTGVASGNPDYDVIEDVATATAGQIDLLLSGDNRQNQPDTVNTSAQGIGVGQGQTLDPITASPSGGAVDGDTLRIDFVIDAVLGGSPDGSEFEFAQHETVNDFFFTISQVTPNTGGDSGQVTAFVKAFDADDDGQTGAPGPDPIPGPISGGNAWNTDAADTVDPIISVEKNGVSLTLNVGYFLHNGGIIVTNLVEGDKIEIATADGFNRVEITNFGDQSITSPSSLTFTDNDNFDVGLLGFKIQNEGAPANFNLDLAVIDQDGDEIAAQLNVSVEAVNTPFVDTGDFVGTVEEEHLNPSPLDPLISAVGNEDETPDPDDADDGGNPNLTTHQVTPIDLTALFSGGDGTLDYGFNVANGAPAEFVGGDDITSSGQAVIYYKDANGTTLWGFVDAGAPDTTYDPASDKAVFSLDISDPSAAVFTLYDNIDHHPIAFPDNIEAIKTLDLSNKIKVTDEDNDTFPLSTVQINIIDDIPTLNNLQVISFDEVPLIGVNDDIVNQQIGLQDISPNYGGFTWNAQTLIYKQIPGDFDPLLWATSSPFNLVKPFANNTETPYAPIVLTQADGDDFSFVGAYFSSAFVDDLPVLVQAFNNGGSLGSTTILVDTGGPAFVDFTAILGFANIDELRFSSSGAFAFDDFTFLANPHLVADEDQLLSPPADFAGNNDADLPAPLSLSSPPWIPITGDEVQQHLIGTLGFNPGADGATVAFNAALAGQLVKDTSNATVQSGGADLTYYFIGTTLYATTVANADNAAAIANAAFSISLDPDTGAYTFTLLNRIDHAAPLPGTSFENNVDIDLAYVVTDGDGDTVTGTLEVSIDDDVPVANDDVDSVTEGLGHTATGNVFLGGTDGGDANTTDGVADTIGADGAAVGGAVTGARTGTEAGGGALTSVPALGATILGTYGDLLINPNGSYTYTLKTASIPVGVTSETFTYQITDGDGDTDLAQLVISLGQDQNLPDTTGSTASVDEDGLNAGGSQAATTRETTTGTFTVDGNNESYTLTLDGDNGSPVTITAVGQTVTTTKGVLTITSISAPDAGGVVTYGYSYTLIAAQTHTGQGEINPLSDTITMAVTDVTGDSDTTPSSIVISIVDDVPTAVADTDNVGTGNSVAGNVITGVGTDGNPAGADTPGADGAVVSHIVSVNQGGSPATVGGSTNINGQYGTLTIEADGDYTYTRTSPSAGVDNFTYTLTDGDGDISTATLTVTLADTGVLVVGTNESDDNSDDPTHTVAGPSPLADHGVINGLGGNDTLIGDPGAVVLTPGQTANIILVLDRSNSMTGADGTIDGGTDRLEAMKDAVQALLDSLGGSGAEQIRVHIVQFGTNAQALGTFDIVVGGSATVNLATAKTIIENINTPEQPGGDDSSQGGTNYEAALFTTYQWINGDTATDPLSGADVNRVLFISDGEPTFHMSGEHGSATGSDDDAEAMAHVLGTASGDNNSNEVNLIENHPSFAANPFQIEAVGISIGDLSNLNDVEDGVGGSGGGGGATNVTSADQLAAIVSVLGGSTGLAAAGSDIINGAAGADVIFGDVPFTDTLAAANGISVPPGSGWAVFQTLEGPSDPVWSRADTIVYILTNQAEIAQESGRTGGNDEITGGTGDDIIYGQEGHDTIFYAIGDGHDAVHGGTDGGTGDTLDVTGTAAGESFFLETVADYNLRIDPDYAGTNEILLSDTSGSIMVEMTEIEHVVVHGGDGADTLTVSGDFTGTSLLTSTIQFFGEEGDDTLDLTGRSSAHRVVADGGTHSTGDTVQLDFAYSPGAITAIAAIADGVSITHDGITDTFTHFENFQFEGGTTLTLAELINDAPTDIALSDNDVDENSAIGTVVGTLSSTDPDNPGAGQTHSYAITGGTGLGLFNIVGNEIRVDGALNFEGAQSYTLQVQSTDNGIAPLSFTEMLTINVNDVNEQPSAGADFATTVADNISDTTVIATVTGTDPDAGGGNNGANNFEDLGYSITAGNDLGLFEINPTTGQISLAAGKNLDAVLDNQHVLTVKVADGPGLNDTVDVTINVVEPNAVPVANNDIVLTNITDGSPIVIPDAALLANDTDADSDPLSISSVQTPAGGIVGHASGDVTFTPALGAPTTEVSQYRFTDVTTTTVAAGGHRAGQFVATDFGDTPLDSLAAPSTFAATLSNTDYNNIESSNDVRFQTNDPGDNNNAVFWAEFNIAEDPSNITQLVFRIEARQTGTIDSGEGLDFGIFNYNTGEWETITEVATSIDNIFTVTRSGNAADYVSPAGKVALALYNEEDDSVGSSGSDQRIQVDNVELDVTHEVAPTFSSGSFDYTATDGAADDDANVTIAGQAGSTVTGSGADEILIGGTGDDTLNGAGGSDVLIGGGGNDTLSGGPGSDVFYWSAGEQGTATDAAHTYNFAGVTQANNLANAHEFEVSSATFTALDALDPTSALNSYVASSLNEATDTQYGQIATDDSSFWTPPVAANNSNQVAWVQFNVTEDQTALTQISINVQASRPDSGVSGNLVLGIWSDGANDWVSLDTDTVSSGTIVTLSSTLTTSLANYVDSSGHLTLVVFNEDTHTGGTGSNDGQIVIDYVSATISAPGGTPTVVDTINGFEVGPGGDVLKFDDLLPAALTNATPLATLDDYLQFSLSGGNTTIHVDHDGGAAFEPTMDVVLQGVDLTALGTLSNQQILQNLITDGNLVLGVGADPIVLDLGAPGLDFSTLTDGVQFDINADGHTDQVAWTNGEDGLLAYDLDGSGKIENGTEIFTPVFAGGHYADGLAALASLDSNSDSKIDSGDAGFDKLVVWQDANHDGVSDAGELKSLSALGITGIDLGAVGSNAYIDGQAVLAEGSFTYADGTTGTFVEVNFDAALGTADAANDDAFDGVLDAEREADSRNINAAALAASVGFGVATAAASAAIAAPIQLDDTSAIPADGSDTAASGYVSDGSVPGTGGETPVVDPLHGTPGDGATQDAGNAGTTDDDASAQGLAPVDSDAAQPSSTEGLAEPEADDKPVTLVTPEGQVTGATVAGEDAKAEHADAASAGDDKHVPPSSGASFEESKAEPLPEVKSLTDHDTPAVSDSGFPASALHASLAERLAALTSLDTNNDGLVDNNDASYNKLAVWQDANQDGVADASELSTLADHGIDGISLNGGLIDGYLDAQSLLAQAPTSGTPLVAVQGSDAQFAKLASLDIGDLLVGGDNYLDLDQALKESALTNSQPGGGEGSSAGGPAASESQAASSSPEAAAQAADAPPPANDASGGSAEAGGEQGGQQNQGQEAQGNDGPAQADAGPNHAEAASVSINIDDGAEQAQNHAVA